MDTERNDLSSKNEVSAQQVEALRLSLSESLHQVKNPVQAIRTFGKLLRREIAEAEASRGGVIPELSGVVEVTEGMMSQSERVLDLLMPMDSVAESMFILGGGGNTGDSQGGSTGISSDDSWTRRSLATKNTFDVEFCEGAPDDDSDSTTASANTASVTTATTKEPSTSGERAHGDNRDSLSLFQRPILYSHNDLFFNLLCSLYNFSNIRK